MRAQQLGGGGGSFKVQQTISKGIGEKLAMLEGLVDEDKKDSRAKNRSLEIQKASGKTPTSSPEAMKTRDVPVYEPIFESTGERKPDEVTPKRARSPLANSSFLWGGVARSERRASPRNEDKLEVSPGNDDEATTNADAYDDVGFSPGHSSLRNQVIRQSPFLIYFFH